LSFDQSANSNGRSRCPNLHEVEPVAKVPIALRIPRLNVCDRVSERPNTAVSDVFDERALIHQFKHERRVLRPDFSEHESWSFQYNGHDETHTTILHAAVQNRIWQLEWTDHPSALPRFARRRFDSSAQITPGTKGNRSFRGTIFY